VSHTPQQNGVGKKLNRTLIKGVHTMLANSKSSHGFWAEALSTYAYLHLQELPIMKHGVALSWM